MPNGLTKKIAGMPAWAWIAVIAGGTVIGLIIRSRQQDAVTEDDMAEEDTVPVDDPVSPDEAGYYLSDPNYALGGAPATIYGAYNDTYTGDQLGKLTEAIVDLTENLPDGTPDDGNTGKKCKPGNKPTGIPKGYHAECRNGTWKIVPNKRGGGGGNHDGDGKGDGGKGHGGKKGGKGGKKDHKRANYSQVAETVVTGGGPPARRNVHSRQGARARTRAQGGLNTGSLPPTYILNPN